MVPNALEVVAVRMHGLNEHLARLLGASGTPRNLQDLLDQVFHGTEIHTVESLVHVKNSDQRYVREMVSLRQHLRADQDIHLAFLYAGQFLFKLLIRTGCVAINSDDPRAWNGTLQHLLYTLGANPEQVYRPGQATGTLIHHFNVTETQVAVQPMVGLVVYQPRIAVSAFRSPSAGQANHHRCETAPIDENQALLTGDHSISNFLQKQT